MTRIVLLDTHAILHRAYHALPDFSSAKGEPTGALYGLISMLIKIINELSPDYLIAAYDLPKATFRHVAFEGYKAKRPKTDDALVSQIKRSRDVLAAFGIPILEAEGFEADDIIGTLAQNLARKDREIIIASGDMDTLQLVAGTRVKVYTLKKGISDTVLYDEDAVRARFGFAPEHIPDYKGLRGDPSDNIPGVKGVGEKSASALIARFGSLDALYKALKKDESLVTGAGVTPRIATLVREQEEEARFSKLLAEIRRDAPVPADLPERPWRGSVSGEKLAELLAELEFRSLVPRVKNLIGAELFPATPASEKPEEQDDPAMLAEAQLMLWLVDSTKTNPLREDILRFTKTETLSKAHAALREEVKKNNLSFVYEEIEKPLRPLLRRMEERGILVDREALRTLSKTYGKHLAQLTERIYVHAGGAFNINSPKQLGDVLFVRMGLVPRNHKKTSGGQKSTRESELEKLRGMHPIIDDILSYRELQKLLSTYIDTIPTLLDDKGRLHTSYLQTGTSTGRLSSQNPNLQNIPIKTDLGRPIRNAFIASEGFELLAFDYSQIELRIAAFLSGDEKLSAIFREGKDIHASVAAEVFGVLEREVTADMRRQAKVINFGILYGMGVHALREALGTTRAEAQGFLNRYFETFATLSHYLDDTKAFALKHGYTKTLYGRRRALPGIRSPIPYIRAAAERMAINAPMQGTQADIVKLAMLAIDRMFEQERLRDDAFLLLQVHDELVFEVKKTLVVTLAPRIRTLMEQVLSEKETNGIPLIAKGARGRSWGELAPL